MTPECELKREARAFSRLTQTARTTRADPAQKVKKLVSDLKMTRTAEDNVQADPGFFATQAIQPSEVPDDNESYVFVDPLSPSLSDISMSSQMLIRRSYEAASANFAVSFWSWALGTILVACLSTLPFVVCALFGASMSSSYL